MDIVQGFSFPSSTPTTSTTPSAVPTSHVLVLGYRKSEVIDPKNPSAALPKAVQRGALKTHANGSRFTHVTLELEEQNQAGRSVAVRHKVKIGELAKMLNVSRLEVIVRAWIGNLNDFINKATKQVQEKAHQQILQAQADHSQLHILAREMIKGIPLFSESPQQIKLTPPQEKWLHHFMGKELSKMPIQEKILFLKTNKAKFIAVLGPSSFGALVEKEFSSHLNGLSKEEQLAFLKKNLVLLSSVSNEASEKVRSAYEEQLSDEVIKLWEGNQPEQLYKLLCDHKNVGLIGLQQKIFDKLGTDKALGLAHFIIGKEAEIAQGKEGNVFMRVSNPATQFVTFMQQHLLSPLIKNDAKLNELILDRLDGSESEKLAIDQKIAAQVLKIVLQMPPELKEIYQQFQKSLQYTSDPNQYLVAIFFNQVLGPCLLNDPFNLKGPALQDILKIVMLPDNKQMMAAALLSPKDAPVVNQTKEVKPKEGIEYEVGELLNAMEGLSTEGAIAAFEGHLEELNQMSPSDHLQFKEVFEKQWNQLPLEIQANILLKVPDIRSQISKS